MFHAYVIDQGFAADSVRHFLGRASVNVHSGRETTVTLCVDAASNGFRRAVLQRDARERLVRDTARVANRKPETRRSRVVIAVFARGPRSEKANRKQKKKKKKTDQHANEKGRGVCSDRARRPASTGATVCGATRPSACAALLIALIAVRARRDTQHLPVFFRTVTVLAQPAEST